MINARRRWLGRFDQGPVGRSRRRSRLRLLFVRRHLVLLRCGRAIGSNWRPPWPIRPAHGMSSPRSSSATPSSRKSRPRPCSKKWSAGAPRRFALGPWAVDNEAEMEHLRRQIRSAEDEYQALARQHHVLHEGVRDARPDRGVPELHIVAGNPTTPSGQRHGFATSQTAVSQADRTTTIAAAAGPAPQGDSTQPPRALPPPVHPGTDPAADANVMLELLIRAAREKPGADRFWLLCVGAGVPCPAPNR